MNAEIIDQDEEGIGVVVTNNEGVKHTIAVGFDGDIQGHSQKGYPDNPAKRTPNENEHVAQAREYARHHIYKETEYNPFPVENNLPGIKRVRTAIQDLPKKRFRELFEDAYQQVDGKDPLPTDLPASLPSEVGPNDWVAFLIDVYLDGTTVEAVSDIHFRYDYTDNTPSEQWNDDPFPDRKADARLQLTFDHVPSLEGFREYLDYHLRCQLRDCYIMAGLEPPEEYKVLGEGQEEIIGRYVHPEITIYDQYHKHHAPISGYELDYDYGMGEYGKIITQLESLTAEDEEIRTAIDQYRDTGENKDQLVDLFEERGFDNPQKKINELIGAL